MSIWVFVEEREKVGFAAPVKTHACLFKVKIEREIERERERERERDGGGGEWASDFLLTRTVMGRKPKQRELIQYIPLSGNFKFCYFLKNTACF